MNKKAVISIIDTLGPDAIASAVPKLGFHAIRAAKTKGFFPAHSFDVIEALCREAGIPCPRNAFSFSKRSMSKGHGNADAVPQGQASGGAAE